MGEAALGALETLMPEVRHADLQGLTMAYYEVGPRSGVPVIFCHGFPELAFSWRNQLKAFAAAGRRAVAPDQRGYGGTDAPLEIESYTMLHFVGDMVDFLGWPIFKGAAQSQAAETGCGD